MHDLILAADIVSPWTVGRYRTLDGATQYAQNTMKGDIAWCTEHGKEFMPVAFPGFSWHNMLPRSPQNEIPRLKGKFLWNEYARPRGGGDDDLPGDVRRGR